MVLACCSSTVRSVVGAVGGGSDQKPVGRTAPLVACMDADDWGTDESVAAAGAGSPCCRTTAISSPEHWITST